MANEQNLRPIKKGGLSKEEAKRRGRKGGKASGAKRKQLKTLADELRGLLQRDIVTVKGQQMNTQEAISTALINAALHGDVKAFNAIRDTLGQKPTEKVETNVSLTSNWEAPCTKKSKKR